MSAIQPDTGGCCWSGLGRQHASRFERGEGRGGEHCVLQIALNISCNAFSSDLCPHELHYWANISIGISSDYATSEDKREGSVISLALSLRHSTVDQQS